MRSSLTAVVKQRHVSQTVAVVDMATTLQDLRQGNRAARDGQPHIICFLAQCSFTQKLTAGVYVLATMSDLTQHQSFFD